MNKELEIPFFFFTSPSIEKAIESVYCNDRARRSNFGAISRSYLCLATVYANTVCQGRK